MLSDYPVQTIFVHESASLGRSGKSPPQSPQWSKMYFLHLFINWRKKIPISTSVIYRNIISIYIYIFYLFQSWSILQERLVWCQGSFYVQYPPDWQNLGDQDPGNKWVLLSVIKSPIIAHKPALYTLAKFYLH